MSRTLIWWSTGAASAAMDDDHIGPYNGHTNRGPDIMANGCLWVAGIFLAFIIVFGGYGFYMDGFK